MKKILLLLLIMSLTTTVFANNDDELGYRAAGLSNQTLYPEGDFYTFPPDY